MVSTVHLFMTILYTGTIAVMFGEGLLTLARTRHMPQEVLQLRLFGKFPALSRSLALLGVGLALGILTVIPIMLDVALPDVWYYVMSSASAGIAWYAILRVGSLFRVPGASKSKPAQEILQ